MRAFFQLDSYAWYTSSNGKWMGFLIVFPNHGKGGKPPRMWKAWKIGLYVVSISMDAFFIRFPFCGILHHMENGWVSSIFSHVMEKATKPLEWRKPGKLDCMQFP